MNALDMQKVSAFVNQNIGEFHKSRLEKIRSLKLDKVLRRKNPYLFRAKNIDSAAELITLILDATLSSSEESIFGQFLEEVAVYVNELACNGQKSSSPGIDLDFTNDSVRYLVAIKSGENWGNSSQKNRLKQDFANALRVVRQSRRVGELHAILGICYGKGRQIDRGNYQEIVGQKFWEFISGDPDLYLKIIDSLGYEAEQQNSLFEAQKLNVYQQFTEQFIQAFCHEDGQIDWDKLVRFNSGN
ncbi:MAG: PmeII family type II restriction endonuclease [Chloroflexota bacterium]